MTTGNERPGASLAEVHILFHGYAKEGDTPSVSRVASTVAFVREGDVRVIIDPGMVSDPASMLEPLLALGESPATITDVIFSHHHPDHTLPQGDPSRYRDRKSTRLNSSHQIISYAVFCLKKKNSKLV